MLGLLTALLAASLTGCAIPNDVLRQNAADALRAGDVRTADRYIAQAVKQDPTDWQAQLLMGQVRLSEQRPLEAETFLKQALVNRQGTSDEPAILDALAQSYLQQGDKGKLAGFLKQCVADHPTTHACLRQAKYLGLAGDADGAVLSYKKAARIADKGDATPYLAAADYYASIHDKESQVTALRRAYTADRENPIVLQELNLAGLTPGPALYLPPEE
jgi:tetratricopeptide (TPR) repeat protein